MTRLFNEPAAFADEMIEGFAASHGRWVKRVSGGVVRNTKSTPDTVALVIGGGSGHYPAFAGLVGQGLAHGAAMGNLFASPSAQQVYNVAKAANNGGGVLLGYGNYAGDVLHFNQAQDRLRKEGIDCRSIAVTDDVSSAPLTERAKRRGIAGDLTVFKVAAAAAEAGYSMDDVVAIAERANDRTRSFGVAFTGCTLPGADHPLFSVPEGRMAVGMGIHGEPGIGETDIPTADGLAELLVAKLLTEIPDGSGAGGPAAHAAWSPSSTAWEASSTKSSSSSTAASPSSSPKPAWKQWTRRWANSSPASTWPAPPSPSSGSTTNSRLSGTHRLTPRPSAAAPSRPRPSTHPT